MKRGGLPAPVVVLCTSRSCSTVFTATLGQHPGLYAFPELNLFLTERLDDLVRLEDGPDGQWADYLAGLVRAVAEVEFGTQTTAGRAAARRWLLARKHWQGQAIFAHLRRRVSPRIVVDKSTRTGMSAEALGRLETGCPDLRVLHLLRRPWDTLASQLRLAARESNPVAQEFFARVWLHTQQLIVDFTARLPATRCLRVQVEHLWRDGDACLREILQWIGLPSDSQTLAAMRQPEHWAFAFPVHPGPAGDGDPTFFFDPKRFQSPRAPAASLKLSGDLSEKMFRWCETLGYE